MPLLDLSTRITARSPILTRRDVNMAHPLNQGLLTWWLAQPALFPSTAVFDVLGVNHGAQYNMAAISPRSGWSPTARIGGLAELAFDGGNDVVGTPTAIGLPAADGVISLAIWGRLDSTTGERVIATVSNGNGGTTTAAIYVEILSNQLQVIRSGGLQLVTTGVAPRIGEWFHLGYTYDGITNTIYLNGVKKGTSTTAHNTGACTSIWMGNWGTAVTDAPLGAFDDLRVYTRRLSDAEMWELYCESSNGYSRVVHKKQLIFSSQNVFVLPSVSARAQVPTPSIPRTIIPSAAAIRTQVTAPSNAQVIDVPAVTLRTQGATPVPSQRILLLAIPARAQVPAPTLTRTIRVTADTVRTQTSTPTIAERAQVSYLSVRLQAPAPVLTGTIFPTVPVIQARALVSAPVIPHLIVAPAISARAQVSVPVLSETMWGSIPPSVARAQVPLPPMTRIFSMAPVTLRTATATPTVPHAMRLPALAARAQVPSLLIPRLVPVQALVARAQIPTPLLTGMMWGSVPALVARARVPLHLMPRIGRLPAVAIRLQVPLNRSTKILRLPAARARAQTPTLQLAVQRSYRPDHPLLTSTFVAGDWLIRAPSIGLKWSFDFQEADNSWDHRILDISPIEMSVPPGGGIATVGNVTIKVAEDRTRQSILQLWQQYPAMNGVPLTIDFLVHGASALPGISNPLRVFTGKIDTITLKNAIADILCVDDSIQQNLLIPQTLVTSAAFPHAISAAYAQPEPIIYGAGSNIGAAPLLLVDIPTNTYLIAGHPMYLGSGTLAVWDQANTLFMAAPGVTTFANEASALVTLGAVTTGVLSWGSGVGVTNGENAVDGNSTTIALINTGTLDSNGIDGYGTLGIFETTAGTPNTNILQVTFINHRRSPGSDPTITGTWSLQTINPSTGQLMRSLYTSPAYRHVTSAQTDIVTLQNTRIAINEQLEAKLIVRNEGGVGTASQTYEVGEVRVEGLVLYSATSAGLTTMTLPINTQEIRFNTISYPLMLDSEHTDPFVITPSNAVDLLSTTYAIIPTCNLDSNLDGVGQLTAITPVTSGQLGNNTLSIDFTNHRRNLSSTATVTGTFFVQTVNPATTTVLRDNLFVSPPYRHQLRALSTSFTAPAINLGANEQIAVRLLARNEGGIGSYNAVGISAQVSTVSFVSTFGSFGAGAGQFRGAWYMAVDTGRNPWVVDLEGKRIQQFTSTGTFLQQLGAPGYGAGQFLNPIGIAIDVNNRVYVADENKQQVQVFTSNGVLVSAFSVPGTSAAPWGIAAAPDGTIWVTDFISYNVKQFTSTGTFLQQFGTSGTGDGQFEQPTGIAVDDSGTLWVCDYDNVRVQAFTNSGVFLRAFGTLGVGQGQFNAPIAVAAGISGTIWVADGVNNTIQRFTSAGSYLLTFGSGGTGNGQFNGPAGIATHAASTVWVADFANNRVQKFLISTISTVIASGANDAYDVGEISIKSFYQPAGGNMPVFLYGTSWMGRYDATGVILSYAGQPSGTFFHTPDQVIASILTQEMGRSVTPSAFANAYTWYARNAVTLDGGIGAGWAVTREPARKVLGDAAQQAAAILYPHFDNSFKLVPFQQDAPIHLAFSVSNILYEEGAEQSHTGPWQETMQITLGNLQIVHNSFELRYAYNAGSRTYGKVMTVDKSGSTLVTNAQYKTLVESLCLQSFHRHGDLQPLILDAYWIADDASAQYLLAFLVQYFSSQRTFVEFETTMVAASLQVGDFISVTHPLLPTSDNGGTFEVHTIRYLPLTGRIHLIASKVATLSTIVRPNDQSVPDNERRGASVNDSYARAQVPTPMIQLQFTPGYAWALVDNDPSHMGALDASGRIFMWGEAGTSCYTGQTPVAIPGTSNFRPHSALYVRDADLQMQYPYQVGSKSDWVDLQCMDDGMSVARDANGFLYMWGFDLGDFFDVESRYLYITSGNDANKFLANTLGYAGLELLTLRLMNTIQWKDFALGMTHIVGVKPDGTVWVWGTNYDGTDFGMPSYPEGYNSKSPIQVQGLPTSPAKLVRAAHHVTVVVTVANEIWVWGTFVTGTPFTVPTQLPFTLPPGASIVSVRISNNGIVILLSSGQVYAWGRHIAFVSTSPYIATTFMPAPGGHAFTSIDVYDRNAGAIDTNKDLWGWGISGFRFLSRNSAFCDVSSVDPLLITTATPGQYAWQTFAIGGFTHTAVTTSGQLMTWGANLKGSLGIGLTFSQFSNTCAPVSTMAPVAFDGSMA